MSNETISTTQRGVNLGAHANQPTGHSVLQRVVLCKQGDHTGDQWPTRQTAVSL